MDRQMAPPVGVGIVTIITVLLVLTLAVLSALTLTSARADLALSQRNAETVTTYYATGSLPGGEEIDPAEEHLPVWGGGDLPG